MTFERPIVGVVAAGAGLGAGELVAGLLPAGRSPVVAVADRVITVAPGGVARAAIDGLGTADKPVLVVGVVVVVLLLGAVAAVVRRPFDVGVVGAVGVLGAWAELRAPDATGVDGVAPLVGAACALVVLRWLTPAPLVADAPLRPDARSRRTLLVAGTASVAALAAGVGQALQRRVDAGASRAAVLLPRAARRLAPVPSSVSVGVDGVAPFVTPNDRFYRIDTALIVPQVETSGWTLSVGGEVERPYSLTFEELLAVPMVEADVTLACVSNEVGDGLVGNARWLGVPVSALLARAGALGSGADQLVGRSVDGFTAGMPLSAVTDPDRDALVAVGMNGEPLPLRHGFPARLVVAGLYGYVSATKWLSSLEVTRFDRFDAYWIQRGWAVEGPIREMTRIDVARPGVVAGVAWAQAGGGVAAVEVRVGDDDGDGSWEEATLGSSLGADTWRQWRFDLPSSLSGRVRLTARCVTESGRTQTGSVAPPFPSGATGWHSVVVDLG